VSDLMTTSGSASYKYDEGLHIQIEDVDMSALSEETMDALRAGTSYWYAAAMAEQLAVMLSRGDVPAGEVDAADEIVNQARSCEYECSCAADARDYAVDQAVELLKGWSPTICVQQVHTSAGGTYYDDAHLGPVDFDDLVAMAVNQSAALRNTTGDFSVELAAGVLTFTLDNGSNFHYSAVTLDLVALGGDLAQAWKDVTLALHGDSEYDDGIAEWLHAQSSTHAAVAAAVMVQLVDGDVSLLVDDETAADVAKAVTGAVATLGLDVVAGLDPAAVVLLFHTIGVVRFTADVFALAASLALKPVATAP